jgi:hypothetical protein
MNVQTAKPEVLERIERKTSLPIHNMSGHLTLYDRRSRCQNKGGGCSYKA